MNCPNCKKQMEEAVGNYHYTECGLDNVFLREIPLYQCECGSKAPILSHIDELHRLIANIVTTRDDRMSGKELKFVRKMMGMKAIDLARKLRVTKQTISNWENEKVRMSPAYDLLLKTMYHCPEVLEFAKYLKPRPKLQVSLDFPTFLDGIRSREVTEAVCPTPAAGIIRSRELTEAACVA
jgi:putative zinc finger/helix-turn-helix YgiT family protein